MALRLLLEVGVFANIGRGFPKFDHVVEDDRQFSRRRGEGFRWPDTPSETAIKCPKRRVTVPERPSGETQGFCGPALHLTRLTALVFAPAALEVGTQPQPGGEMFRRRPFTHVSSHFRKQDLDRGRLQTWNLCQIDARDFIDV